MIIVYDPQTLAVQYTANQYSQEFRDYIEAAGNCVEWNDTASIEQIRLALVDGEVTVSVLPFMQIAAPDRMIVGVESEFFGIPEGSSVSVNGAPAGEMDASGVLEFTPETDGVYRFRFEHPDFVPCEVSREASAS